MTSDRSEDANTQSVRDKIREQQTTLIQEGILSSAARLIAERSFRAVRVEDISADMGFTKSIIYYYMKNKTEILWQIFQRIDRTYAESLDSALACPGGPVETMKAVIRSHSTNVLEHQHWAVIYNRDEAELEPEQQAVVSTNKRRYTRRIQDLYQSGVQKGVFRDIPPALAVSCLIGACNWPYTWFKPTRFSISQIADSYADQLVQGIAV